jgi:hypothetical protein
MEKTKKSFEKKIGQNTSELPAYRLPIEVVNFEIDLLKDLGVKERFFLVKRVPGRGPERREPIRLYSVC